jgi:predicted NUDIX family NTP pyrophosphohydrolase
MTKVTAGLLMCRKNPVLEFFLIHPGGPFFAKKNEGTWSIPKGLPEDNEDLLQTAQREFFEETGFKPTPPFHALGTAKMKSGKVIHAWCFEGDWDPEQGIVSNVFTLEWPPASKQFVDFPEADRAEWMAYDQATKMIHPQQVIFLTKAKEFFEIKG